MTPAAPAPALVAAFTFGEIFWIALLVTGLVLALRFWRQGPDLKKGLHQGLREFQRAAESVPEEIGDRLRPGADPFQEAITPENQTIGFPPRRTPPPESAIETGGFLLWLAQGFGSGRLKPAPGTWGSVVGMLWTLALLAPGWPWAYALGTLVAIGLAVPVCTEAGRRLGDPDPGSVVLDEIVAVPMAFAGYAGLWWWQAGELPAPAQLRQWWPALLAAFALFRLFDIWKPWPIRSLQRLPGGWGVVLDDVAAGLVAAGCLWGGTWAMFWYRLARG